MARYFSFHLLKPPMTILPLLPILRVYEELSQSNLFSLEIKFQSSFCFLVFLWNFSIVDSSEYKTIYEPVRIDRSSYMVWVANINLKKEYTLISSDLLNLNLTLYDLNKDITMSAENKTENSYGRHLLVQLASQLPNRFNFYWFCMVLVFGQAP